MSYHLKKIQTKQVKRDIYFNCRNKELQCCDWWTNLFDQPVKNDLRTYHNIRKTATRQGHDYTIGSLVNYPYFEEYFKMIAIDLSKQQELGIVNWFNFNIISI